MKQTVLLSSLAIVILLCAPVHAAGPTVTSAVRHDTSPPLRDLASTTTQLQSSDQQNIEPQPTGNLLNSGVPDPVAQQLNGISPPVTSGLSFDGQNAQDTRNIFGFAFVPPDTNGAPGFNQYVQIVNVTIAVYDKRTGALLMTPVAIHTLWSGFGGACEFDSPDGGDPVVLYDHLAKRWLVTQLQYNSNLSQTSQCIAVSTTSDATGSYNRYEFPFGANFPDYPKYGIWPDGYYNTVNIFNPHFAGAEACAFDRSAMLAGQAANMICFQQASSVSSLLPSDLDGSTLPPAGSPNYFVGLADSSHLYLFKFHPDFAHPITGSTFTGPTFISVAPFSEICARATTVACIPEPNPGEKVDGLSDRVMFRLAYRNFGDHESLVVNHTVAGGALGADRWYEIRNPGSTPFVFQQGTIFDPNVNYWLGSVAMDKAGDLALGFSASGKQLAPSIYVAGRASTDPVGALSGPLVLAGGLGVQVQSFKRWGDYSAMTLDPADDCTFWYTNEYYPVAGTFSINWSTRISSFKFNACK